MATSLLSRSAAASSSRVASSPFNLLSLASALPSAAQTSALHTTAAVAGASRSRKERNQLIRRKKTIAEVREIRNRVNVLTKPCPVLGHQLNETGETLWRNSELAQVVLSKDAVWGVKEDRRGNLIPVESASIDDEAAAQEARNFGGPPRLNFGLQRADREMLFSALPSVIAEDRILDSPHLTAGSADGNALNVAAKLMTEYEKDERAKAQTLARILDLRNASGKGIQVENIRRIVEHFGARKDTNTLDTGSPEVQVAVLTYRIRNMAAHLTEGHRKDHSNRRSMALLVYQRVRHLKYLKRLGLARYKNFLPRVGLEARAVEGEVVVPGMPKTRRGMGV